MSDDEKPVDLLRRALQPKKHLPPEQLLAAIEEVLTYVPEAKNKTVDCVDWLGRAGAAFTAWSEYSGDAISIATWRAAMMQTYGKPFVDDLVIFRQLLAQAQAQLRMNVGPVNRTFKEGQTYDFFSETCRLLAQASSDVLLVDRYMNADLVTSYFPSIAPGARVRLLTWDNQQANKKVEEVSAHARKFSQQHGTVVEIRRSADIHERFIVLDGRRFFQCGASIKDGGTHKVTTLLENIGGAKVLFPMCEELWQSATVVPL